MSIAELPDGVHLGVAPLSWTNDVLEELGGDTPLETCLGDAAENGYEGIELGRKFPRDAEVLKPLLDGHGLQLASGWYSGFLAERGVAEEMAAVEAHARLLVAMGAGVMVYGPVGHMPDDPFNQPLSHRLTLDHDEMKDYADRLADFDHRLFDTYGLRLAYHHHVFMVAETLDEVSRLMDRARCGLLLDTGHAAGGGFAYERLIDRFGDLIVHIHLKDVRASRLEEARARDMTFNDGVRLGMFTVPGDGDIDFMPLARFVKDSGYRGWMVVEAEQDPARPEAEPRAATKRAFDHVISLFR